MNRSTDKIKLCKVQQSKSAMYTKILLLGRTTTFDVRQERVLSTTLQSRKRLYNYKFKWLGILIYWWQTNGQTDICDSRVAFATEKLPLIIQNPIHYWLTFETHFNQMAAGPNPNSKNHRIFDRCQWRNCVKQTTHCFSTIGSEITVLIIDKFPNPCKSYYRVAGVEIPITSHLDTMSSLITLTVSSSGQLRWPAHCSADSFH